MTASRREEIGVGHGDGFRQEGGLVRVWSKQAKAPFGLLFFFLLLMLVLLEQMCRRRRRADGLASSLSRAGPIYPELRLELDVDGLDQETWHRWRTRVAAD